MNYDLLTIGGVIVLLLLALFFIPQWRMKRAIPQVIRTFRERSATSARDARTIDELGLRPRSLVQGMFRGRDYRQYALEMLLKAEIVVMTEERKLYLSEDKLYSSGLDKRLLPSRYSPTPVSGRLASGKPARIFSLCWQ